MTNKKETTYGEALREAANYVLEKYPETFVIGQGVWSPWYVGNSMTNLEKKFGRNRVIDTPTSESAITGMAVGAALSGKKSIVVHPRMDFALYAMDAIINQAAKWSYMFGGQDSPNVTIRTIINRGGEQGAQHSQALQALFSHIPGLRVVMPYSVDDARDLFIASVLSKDPVIFIDDRWLYDNKSNLSPIKEIELSKVAPKVIKKGTDLTIVSSGFSSHISLNAAKNLVNDGINIEVIDLRVLSPLNIKTVVNSVKKTRKLICVDGGWAPCGISSEVITSVIENIDVNLLKCSPQRITLPFTPAPTSKQLEKIYYPSEKKIIELVKKIH
tara:strand:- start:637 stop:1623 length:987 start_codon:yes stop_codon:yes gene_type:complete